MCAFATMVSLKFPLQDPLQQAASSNTAIISNKLICFNKQIDLFNHPTPCIILWDAVSLLMDVLSACVLIERLPMGENLRASQMLMLNNHCRQTLAK